MLTLLSKRFTDARALNTLVFIVCCVGTGIWAVVLGQDINWDLKNYHFYNPYSFLNDKLTYDHAPAMMQSYNNPLLDFPIYWLIKTFPPIVVGFVVGFVQGLNLFILYCISKRATAQYPIYYKQALVLAMCAFGFYSVANLCEIGTAFGDNLVSIFILFPVLLLTNNYFDNQEKNTTGMKTRILVIAGLIMGCGVAMKLTVAIFPIAMGIALIWISSGVRSYIRNSFILGLSVFSGFVLSIGYWSAILWQHFQNPMFPYFNKVFKSPYFGFYNLSDTRFLPDTINDKLFYPFYFITEQTYTSEFPFQDMHFAVCYVLLIVFLAYFCYQKIRQRKMSENSIPRLDFKLFILTLFAVSYALWQFGFSIYRYVVVLEFLSPVFIFLILDSLFKNKKHLTVVFTLLTVITLWHLKRMDFGRLPWTDSYFGVELPKVPNLDKANIVLGSNEPLAYMVPYFPVTTRFLRVQGNMMSLKKMTIFQNRIKQRLNSSNENYLLLNYMTKNNILLFEEKFNQYVDSSECTYFKTRLDDSLCICRLSKTTPRSTPKFE